MAMCENEEMAQDGEVPPFTLKKGIKENFRFEGIRVINAGLMGVKFISQYEDEKKGVLKFLEVARGLSQMIPKISDESLLVIDDILYEIDKEYQVQEYPELKSDDLDGLAIELYNKHYIDMIDKGFYSSELDNIYIRLAENLEGDHFKWIFRTLAPSRDVKKICLFLKIFKSRLSAKMDKAVSNIKDMAIRLGIPFFLMKLSKFPKLSDDTDNGKIVKFIAEQADACLKSFESDTMNLEEPKEFVRDSLVRFERWYYKWPSYYQYILLDVFMSAKDVNEEKEFLLVFQKELNRFCRGLKSNNDGVALESIIYGFALESINNGVAFIFTSLSHNLIEIARYIVEEHFEKDMRYIDELHGYNIEHYGFEYELPEGVNKLAAKDIINNICEPSIACLRSSDNLRDSGRDSIMKFLIYDDFMKCLHLMSILHSAYVKYEDIKDFDKDEMSIYYGGEFGLSCFEMPLRHKLYSEIRDRVVSWPLEMAIMKCPFLYFMPRGYHLKEEYLMLLKGELNDETLREEILDNLY